MLALERLRNLLFVFVSWLPPVFVHTHIHHVLGTNGGGEIKIAICIWMGFHNILSHNGSLSKILAYLYPEIVLNRKAGTMELYPGLETSVVVLHVAVYLISPA